MQKILGIMKLDFDATGQLLIIYSKFVRYLKKIWGYNEAGHHLFIAFKNVYDSVRKEVLYNIVIAFGIPMKFYCF